MRPHNDAPLTAEQLVLLQQMAETRGLPVRKVCARCTNTAPHYSDLCGTCQPIAEHESEADEHIAAVNADEISTEALRNAVIWLLENAR